MSKIQRYTAHMISGNMYTRGDNETFCKSESVSKLEATLEERDAEIERLTKRIEELEKFAVNIVDGYDHCSDAHTYNNLAACYVCEADKILRQSKRVR
jgi:hypothetical protein